MSMLTNLLILFAVAAWSALSSQSPQSSPPPAPADLVLTNGRILTVDAARPEAQAIAVRGDRIVALGTSAEMARYRGPATGVIDLKGQIVVPGFIESHGHFAGVGEAQLQLNLMETRSWQDVVSRVAAAVKTAKPGEWVVGRGWHQDKWASRPSPAVEGFPTHASLDAVSPDNPVLLTHASGHAAFVNARALALSNITRATPSPAGGEILKSPDGEPTGLLREAAADRLRVGAGDPGREERALALASAEVLSKGITSFHDAGSSFATIDLMKRMIDQRRIGVRLYVMVSENNARAAEGLARYRTIDYGGGFLTVRAIKRQIDGALGSRGAWLLAPYADKLDSVGLNTTPLPSLEETARLAMAHDYQLCVHAIGDRANRETLDLFERALQANPAKRGLRWRVEHAQHLNPADIPRFGRLGVIASMQTVHATSDAPYVIDRLGSARAEEGAYVWQKLLKSGAIVANGTDAPVENVDPIANFHAAVSRRMKSGAVFYPDQRMSRREALEAATINGAYASFEERSRGSLAVGKLADMTVLSQDITTVPEDRILATTVVYTIVGGKVAFRR